MLPSHSNRCRLQVVERPDCFRWPRRCKGDARPKEAKKPMSRNPILSVIAKAVAAVLRWALANAPARPRPASDRAHAAGDDPREHRLRRDLRREVRERRGV